MQTSRLLPLVLCLIVTACSLPQAAAPTPPATPELRRDLGLQESRDPALPWPLFAPPGFKVTLYAHDLGEVRGIAFSPTGVPYVTIMNRRERNAGKVLAIPDDNGDGRADRTIVVSEGIDRAHGIAFYKGQLYVAAVDSIFLLPDANGDMVADSRVPIVTNIPAVGDHWARPFLFDSNGNILVAVGSTCNMCQEKDERRATVLRYPSGGTPTTSANGEIFARGMRSIVDMKFRPGTNELWAPSHGPDHLGALLPPDQVFHIEEGKHYGWPYCYGDRQPDLQAADNPDILTPDGSPREIFCRDKVSSPALLLAPHSAPNGIVFYTGSMFPAEYQGDMFLALHGSYAYLNTNGYRVVRVPMRNGVPGVPEDFLSGWTPPGASTWNGRPSGIAVAPDGSLFVTDDFKGFVYRVSYDSKH